jgi:AraC-like DNA-binding protein
MAKDLNSPAGRPPALLRVFFACPPFASEHIEVVGLGCREWMAPGMVDRPRGTDDWLIMVFHQGVEIGVEGDLEAVAGPALVVWQPLAPHHYGRRDQAWCHSWMHVAGPTVERLVRLAGLPIDRPMIGVEPAEVERCVLALHEEIASGRPDPVIAECLLRVLLHQIARRVLGGAMAIAPGLLAARRHLEDHFAEPLRLADLARRAELSRNHFCTAFRQAFNLSPYDFALRLRLEHARVLLRDRNRSIGEVAAAVGYDDPASFARLVRRRFGHGPGALR